MKVDSLKIRIITRPKSATRKIKLVRKYELKCLRRIVERGNSPNIVRGGWIDEIPVAGELRDL